MLISIRQLNDLPGTSSATVDFGITGVISRTRAESYPL